MSNAALSVGDATDTKWVNRIIAGVVAGLAGGIVMGVILQLGTELMPVFGRLLGSESILGGWIVHLATSALFGLLFAIFVSMPLVAELETTVGTSVLLAVIHASALSYVTIGLILPAATIVLGVENLSLMTEIVPGPGAEGLATAGLFSLGHVVYGVVLGAVYASLLDLHAE